MAAVTVETVKTIALVTLGALVVIGLVMLKLVVSMMGKVVVLVVLGGFAVVVWTQRTELLDCADSISAQAQAQAQAQPGGTTPPTTSCTFFGYEVEVEVPGA